MEPQHLEGQAAKLVLIITGFLKVVTFGFARLAFRALKIDHVEGGVVARRKWANQLLKKHKVELGLLSDPFGFVTIQKVVDFLKGFNFILVTVG